MKKNRIYKVFIANQQHLTFSLWTCLCLTISSVIFYCVFSEINYKDEPGLYFVNLMKSLFIFPILLVPYFCLIILKRENFSYSRGTYSGEIRKRNIELSKILKTTRPINRYGFSPIYKVSFNDGETMVVYPVTKYVKRYWRDYINLVEDIEGRLENSDNVQIESNQ